MSDSSNSKRNAIIFLVIASAGGYYLYEKTKPVGVTNAIDLLKLFKPDNEVAKPIDLLGIAKPIHFMKKRTFGFPVAASW